MLNMVENIAVVKTSTMSLRKAVSTFHVQKNSLKRFFE